MAALTPQGYAAEIIELCAASPIVLDHGLDIRDTVVLRCRIQLVEGFVAIYRNFRTGTTAYAWVVGEERLFGADNTGGWHRHPAEDPTRHEPCPPVALADFLRELEILVKARDKK